MIWNRELKPQLFARPQFRRRAITSSCSPSHIFSLADVLQRETEPRRCLRCIAQLRSGGLSTGSRATKSVKVQKSGKCTICGKPGTRLIDGEPSWWSH